MDVRQIQELALQRGVTVRAVDAIVTRVQAHFAGATPSPHEIGQFIEGLFVWDKIGMEQQEFLGKPGTWQMDQARVFEPPPAGAHPRRPVTRNLTPEELAAHDAQAAREGWSQAEYIEKARALQQTPAPTEETG